jgi:hypothetical protein
MTGEEHLINIDEEHCQKKMLYIIEELALTEDDQDMIMEFMK